MESAGGVGSTGAGFGSSAAFFAASRAFSSSTVSGTRWSSGSGNLESSTRVVTIRNRFSDTFFSPSSEDSSASVGSKLAPAPFPNRRRYWTPSLSVTWRSPLIEKISYASLEGFFCAKNPRRCRATLVSSPSCWPLRSAATPAGFLATLTIRRLSNALFISLSLLVLSSSESSMVFGVGRRSGYTVSDFAFHFASLTL